MKRANMRRQTFVLVHLATRPAASDQPLLLSEKEQEEEELGGEFHLQRLKRRPKKSCRARKKKYFCMSDETLRKVQIPERQLSSRSRLRRLRFVLSTDVYWGVQLNLINVRSESLPTLNNAVHGGSSAPREGHRQSEAEKIGGIRQTICCHIRITTVLLGA
jgi:hypothetical protein